MFNGGCGVGSLRPLGPFFSRLGCGNIRLYFSEGFVSRVRSSPFVRDKVTAFSSSVRNSVTVSLNNSNALLGATGHVNQHVVPVLNVGLKQLNFLASIRRARLPSLAQRVLGRGCAIRRHAILGTCGRRSGAYRCTVGRISILGRSLSSVVSVSTCLGGRRLGACRTSKLIMSAPANSATCSLDIKNPVVVPRGGGLVVTPMTSRSLGTHPLVMPSAYRVHLRVGSHDRSCLTTVSNHDVVVGRGGPLMVAGTSCGTHAVHVRKRSFLGALGAGLV